ncbi:hypothetical protein [Roseomonas chloroacetimidivorans]|uniref:hypothetical protein n=1 Tax=Roseomonas chloroacetimidivorans TaxID=1766656 RepID=UPI003C72E3FB
MATILAWGCQPQDEAEAPDVTLGVTWGVNFFGRNLSGAGSRRGADRGGGAR